MRCLRRNKSVFYYALYEGKSPIVDDYGNVTGEYETKYGNPVSCKANISAAVGEMQIQQFGDSETYDKVIVMDTSAPQIDEHTVLWIDRVPKLNADGTLELDSNGEVVTPHDYIVKKVAKSLNSVAFAVSKVVVK